MTDFEKRFLDLSKLNGSKSEIEILEEIKEIKDSEEFKAMEPSDRAAIMSVMSLRMNLANEGMTDRENEGKALWRFIRYLTEIEMPLKFTDFTYLLFPDNEKYFANILTPTAFHVIVRQAAAMLENNNYENEEHKVHLEKIANGQMPYGYSIEMPSLETKED